MCGGWESLDCDLRGHTTGQHCFTTGSCSQKEHFFDTSRMSDFINGYTGETCCTYNMLKLSRHMFCWNADPAAPEKKIRRAGTGLTFVSDEGDTLVPLYEAHRCRYVVYWDIPAHSK